MDSGFLDPKRAWLFTNVYVKILALWAKLLFVLLKIKWWIDFGWSITVRWILLQLELARVHTAIQWKKSRFSSFYSKQCHYPTNSFHCIKHENLWDITSNIFFTVTKWEGQKTWEGFCISMKKEKHLQRGRWSSVLKIAAIVPSANVLFHQQTLHSSCQWQ